MIVSINILWFLTEGHEGINSLDLSMKLIMIGFQLNDLIVSVVVVVIVVVVVVVVCILEQPDITQI